MSDAWEALQAARTEASILEALARRLWEVDGSVREPEVPTAKDLTEWVMEAPAEARIQATWRLLSLPDHPFGRPPAGLTPLEALHERWGQANPQPRHPIAPILRAWWEKPRSVTRNGRDDAMLTGALLQGSRQDSRVGKMFAPAMHVASRDPQIELLPGFGAAPNPTADPVTPVLPLALYEAGGGPSGRSSRGAPLVARMFTEAVVSVGSYDWQSASPVVLEPMRFRDFLHTIYPPDAAARWRPGQRPPGGGPSRWEGMRWHLEALESIRVAWENPDGSGAERRVVSVVDMPRDGRRKDWIRLQVHLPPGVEGRRGVIWDRPAMRLAGVESYVAWRLAASLATWWSRPGVTIRPPKGGAPWRQSRQLEHYPLVCDEVLIAMAYPASDRGRNASRDVRKALAYLTTIGYIEVHDDPEHRRGRRIMPGLGWAGWNSPEDRRQG